MCVQHQKRDADDAGIMQSENKDDDTRNLAQNLQVPQQPLTHEGCGCSERNKYQAETGDKPDRLGQGAMTHSGIFRAQRIHGHPADVGEVGGHQRQHAW